MAQQEIQVRSICGMAFAIIVQGVDLAVWKWNSTQTVAPAVVPIGILVQVVPKMQHVVDRVFSCRIPVCIEKPKRVVAARVDRKADFRHQIIGIRRRLRAANGTFEVGIADGELIVVLGERPQFLRLNLFLTAVNAPASCTVREDQHHTFTV